MTTFKVVEDQSGLLVFKGKDGGGLAEDVAQADAKHRNDKAAQLGIKTRYVVQQLGESEALAA